MFFNLKKKTSEKQNQNGSSRSTFRNLEQDMK